jgi:hypothetical protein
VKVVNVDRDGKRCEHVAKRHLASVSQPRLTPALLAHAIALVTEVLRFSGPADEALSRYFRAHRALGQSERAFVAETVVRGAAPQAFARGGGRRRAAPAGAQRRWCGCSASPAARSRAFRRRPDRTPARRSRETLAPAVLAELPDWLWLRLASVHGEKRPCASRRRSPTRALSTCASISRARAGKRC